jgi:flagellar basal-body rod modification protein FlgD
MLTGLTNNASPSQLPQPQQTASNLQDQFLKMLLTQLQNQDPSQPVDDTQMVSEQAQFANLEQSQNLNVQLSTLLAQQNVSQATNMIGKTVAGKDSNGKEVAGTVLGVSFAGGVSTLAVDTGNGARSAITLPNVESVGE